MGVLWCCILHQHLINIFFCTLSQAYEAVSRASVAPKHGLLQRKHEDRGSRCTKSKRNPVLYTLNQNSIFCPKIRLGRNYWRRKVKIIVIWQKILVLTLGQKSLFLPKIHIWKSHFWQNSQFENLIFDKIHIFRVSFLNKIHIFKNSFLAKFTFSKRQFSQKSHFQSLIFH